MLNSYILIFKVELFVFFFSLKKFPIQLKNVLEFSAITKE